MRRIVGVSAIGLAAALVATRAAWAASYTFTQIDFPGATFTAAHGIETAGDLVGGFAAPTGVHGFVRSPSGAFTQIDAPAASFTVARGINDGGQIVGEFVDSAGHHGFLRATEGTFTAIDGPGAFATVAHGINVAGQVVGSFSDSAGTHGFVRAVDGTLTQIDVTGATETVARGIDTAGKIVGYFRDSTGTHGFVRLPDSTLTQFDVPGQPSTFLFGINDAGRMVGVSGLHGFLRNPDDSIALIDVPAATASQAFGVNARGEIVGLWFVGTTEEHGFLATPNVTAFDTFEAAAAIKLAAQQFAVAATFTLGAGSNGIAPLTEPVSLQLGTFATTVPAGSFQLNQFTGVMSFKGTVDGVALQMAIIPLGGNRFVFAATGQNANLAGTVNPVSVTLTIGDDSGTTRVTALVR